jgi:hypothetical protein
VGENFNANQQDEKTLREIRRYSPKVFQNKPPRRIFGPEKEAVTERRRKKLHSEELQVLYSSLHIRRVVKSRMTDLKGKMHAKDT